MADRDFVLARVDKARELLAQADNPAKAKQVADMAGAMEVLAKRQKMSDDVIRHATAIRVDALTLAGELLKRPTTTKHKGGRPTKTGSKREPVSGTPTLAELGIDKKESSEMQALADLKAEDPDTHEAVRNGETTIRKVREQKKRGEEPPPRYPHSDRIDRWTRWVAGETYVIDIELGGIKTMLGEPDKWDWPFVRRDILPRLDSLQETIAQFSKEIRDAEPE